MRRDAACVSGAPAPAATVTFLGIEGELGAGGAGNYPLDAEFSWISHRFPGSTTAHIWTLAPGSDGGMRVGAAQPGAGEITLARAMCTVVLAVFGRWRPTVRSARRGLRSEHGQVVLGRHDLRCRGRRTGATGRRQQCRVRGEWLVAGGGDGTLSPGVPRRRSVRRLRADVHLTGQITLVPLPPAAWLFGAGLVVLIRSAGRARVY